MALDRSQIKIPVLSKETVHFEPLGGEVIVRGLLMAEQMANSRRKVEEAAPRDGETEAEAIERAGAVMAIRMLSQAVIAPDGKPLLTQAQWEAIGATQPAEIYGLAQVIFRLSGVGTEDVEKN